MSAKQDCVAARTAQDLERKYRFDRAFEQVLGEAKAGQDAAAAAARAAAAAARAVLALDQSLDHDEIYDRFTDGGNMQAFVKNDDGQIFINVAYLLKGPITSADGSVVVDLANNTVDIMNGDTQTLHASADGVVIHGKTVEWLDSGDGTFTLIGKEVA